jgi:hypothetical protein
MERKLVETRHCDFWIVKPGKGEIVRPLVHVGDADSYFQEHAKLLAFINGTFFNAQSKTPYVFGDIKTDSELAWGFSKQPSQTQGANGQYYWRPAGGSTADGYGSRWAIAVDVNGKPRMVQGQPGIYHDFANDAWAMGGGALLLQGGQVPFSSIKVLADPANGGFTRAQTRSTNRSFIAITGSGQIHLGVNRDVANALAVAQGLKQAGYTDALLLDGGGATTLLYRDVARNVTGPFRHSGYKRLHSGMGVLSHVPAASLDK